MGRRTDRVGEGPLCAAPAALCLLPEADHAGAAVRAGTVTYGPNVNAAAILLASQGNVPVAATAGLMAALLGSPVSTGFVARAHERFADVLGVAGFDGAMIAALPA